MPRGISETPMALEKDRGVLRGLHS